MRARGFDSAAATLFGVGYAPRGGEDLVRHLCAKGFQDEEVYVELYSSHCTLADLDAAGAALDRGIAALPESAFLYYWRHSHRSSRGDKEGSAQDRARAVELGFRFHGDG